MDRLPLLVSRSKHRQAVLVVALAAVMPQMVPQAIRPTRRRIRELLVEAVLLPDLEPTLE